MIRIADLLDRDFSRPVAEIVKVNNDDPDTVFTEMTEYVAPDRIKAGYESLFSAMAASPGSPNESVGVWISGFFGSGKSSFAKNLGYVLANPEVLGVRASSLFLKRVESQRLTGYIEFLNRAVPYEVFKFDFQVDLPAKTSPEPIADVMYRVLLRDLDYAEDHDISELEIELEKEGKLVAFQDLCRAEYKVDWRKIRKGSRRFARTSCLLHRLDARTYASTDTWLDMVKARPSRRLSVKDLVAKLFDLCEIRRHGKSFAFILDEMSSYVVAPGGERLENLCAVVEQFGKESLQRLKAGKIPGPAWIVVTAEEPLQEVVNRVAAGRVAAGSTDLPKPDLPTPDLPKPDLKLQDLFQHQIDLSSAGIHEVAARRVLRKKESQEFVLREMFRARGAALIQNVKLEGCSRRTEFDEDEFVRLYPYLPHLIDLSIDIMAGIRLHPKAPQHPSGGNRTIVKQCFEMIVSDQTQLEDQPVGVLVSIDKIYELVEGNIPLEKQQNVLDIHQRFDHEDDYGGMAARVAKAICLMEFVKNDLPRTTKNIAALLVHRVNEGPPTLAVAEMLHQMKEAQFVRETEDGWKLYDFDELRRAAAALEGLNNAVGTVNPRLPGWRNDLVQLAKKLLARALTWYTRPLHDFNASVSRLVEEIVGALGRLSAKMAASERLAVDMVALEARLAQSEKKSANLMASMQEQLEILHEQVQALAGLRNGDLEALAGRMATDGDKRARKNSRFYVDRSPGNDRTAYIVGLFGSGRRYINEQMLRNIGQRAKYFRDTIRLHPGPTPMIYSGHATIRHVSSLLQYPPVMTGRIVESVRAGFADLIFVHRHPLDSLLTNWIWWRTYIRENRMIDGISQAYENTGDLCADLELNFLEFEAFAKGDPDFFAGVPGPRFLSFPEFVEETELHLQSATLAVHLEDCMIDPVKEFSKIAEVMSVDLDVSRLCVAPPRTKPYGYLAVKDKVPRFRDFFDGLDAETKNRIEKIGYDVTI